MQLIRAVRDIASHVNEGGAPAVEFRRLLPAGHSAVRPPLFLLGAITPLVAADIFGQVTTPEIGCYVLENAAVGPTGIALKGDTAFCSASFVHPPHHVVAVVDRLNSSPLPVRHVPGPLAVIYGPGHETHGHWLTDFMPRLSVLYDSGFDLPGLRFLVPPDLSDSAAELLRLCGILDTQLVQYRYWKEVVATDILLMPTCPRLGNRMSPYFAEASRFWLRRIKAGNPARAPAAPRRIFVSRATAPQSRVMSNRGEIEIIARRYEMTIVQPELMPFLEQLALFEAASEIVGEYGSGLHNSIFAPAGTVVCGLRGNSRHPSFVQTGIATALGQQMGYVCGDTAEQDVTQNFQIAVRDFELALDLMALHGRCPAPVPG